MEKNTRHRKILGTAGESLAEQFYREQGCEVLEKNFIFRHGEIDLIVKDRDEVVFVEVKTRRGTRFGLPEEAVTPLKQHYIRRAAEGFLWLRHLESKPCRFDVFSVTTEKGQAKTRQFRAAF
ncbi:MAG: YraN family protein [Acidobacteriota bacterium]